MGDGGGCVGHGVLVLSHISSKNDVVGLDVCMHACNKKDLKKSVLYKARAEFIIEM